MMRSTSMIVKLALIVACCSADSAAADKVDEAWRQLFDSPSVLQKLSQPVVCFLFIQHPDIIRTQLQEKPAAENSAMRTKNRLAELSGLPCVMLHFTEVKPGELERPQVKAILISGRSKSYSRELDQSFYPLIRQTKIPMIGFCGGMQMIGQAYGAKVAALRKLHPGEKDPNPKYHPGQFKEWGFLPVKVGQRDPLFAGLPDELIVREYHAFHMLEPPAGFRLLASSVECPVQAIKHDTRVLYGVQFHPEAYDDEHPHGRELLANFFGLIGLGQK